MAEHDRNRDQRDTPGGIIAMSAFKYAIQFFQYADPKYPDLKKMADDTRHAAFQAAIVVSTLIQQERVSPDGAKALRESLNRGFPPSARRRCLTAVQDLAAYMLKVERETIGQDEIPAMAPLPKFDDKQLQNTLSIWLGGVIMDKWTLGEADKPAAGAMARSAWTSAVMIGRELKKAK